MQNGSARELHWWGVMNFIESDDDRPDSFYLARLLEERDADDYVKMVTVFSELERKKISLGVVVVYDMLTDTFLCISDGARSLYVWLDDEEKKIDYFSSLDDSWDDGYSMYGWFISDMKGIISHSEFKYLNKYVEKKTTPPASSYYGIQSSHRRFDSATQTWIEVPTNLYNWDRDAEDEYYSNRYANALEARERTKVDPSWGDNKAPNDIKNKTTYGWNQTALIVQKEEKVYEIWGTRAKTEIEKALEDIARWYQRDYDWLDTYSDNVVLNVGWLLETAVFTELEEYFFDRYRHAQERYQQWEKWVTYQKLLTNLEQCMEAIEDELGIRRDLWVDNFYELDSPKQISDTQAIDTWIENKMEILRFHMADLYT